MLGLISETNNPYYNIATEELLLRKFSEDIFFLYQNEPSVIVGKHQNTLAEINYWLAKNNKISVVRRLSGGGAVYHDLGNVNFSFIRSGKEGALVDFKGFTKPIIDALGAIGIEAEFQGHNSLYVNGMKISGNAEHVFKNRVMHHGTLLFSSNLDMLSELLYVSTDKFSDRAVKSVRANVTNISDHLKNEISIAEFKAHIFNYVSKNSEQFNEYQLSVEEKRLIQQMVLDKYSTWDWNFGYSPSYSFEREGTFGEKIIKIVVLVQKGEISKIKIEQVFLSPSQKESIESTLSGCKHRWNDVSVVLNRLNLPETFSYELMKMLF